MNRLIALISAAIFSSPVLARAEEAMTLPEAEMSGAVHEAVQEEAHQASSGGLPQFNPESWPSQIFWLAVSFFVLYFFFSKFIIPSLSATIEARANKIEGDLKAAEELSAQAEQIKLGYEAELKKASSQAASDMKQIDEEAKAKLASSLAEFRNRYETEVFSVEKNLEQAKQGAMQDMQKIAADVAAAAAEKIAGIPADSAQAANIVNQLKNKAA